MTSGAVKALRLIRLGLQRYGLPTLVVAAVVALPGAARPDRRTTTPHERPDHEQEWADSPLDPPRPRPRVREPELVSSDDLSSTTSEPSAPVVGALADSGIPAVALRAYRAAETTLAVTDSTCGLRWSLVAAIGRVESNHGRFGGAQLRADGTGTRPIRGIALDGRPGVAAIHDTDDGRLDDDPVFDRAVGPMQFIPSSWSFAAADGNGDGVKDPDNIFDAALAAGGYLCAGDTNLRDPSQRSGAVFRYNHSDEYVALVLALAARYERGVTPLPTVPGSSSPPPVLPSPQLPPASVTPPPFGQEPTTPPPTRGHTPGSTTTTSSSTTTSTTTPCPTTTTTSSTVPDPSSTTTETTVPPTSSPGTTVPPGCPTTTTTTTTTTVPSTTSTTAAPSTSEPSTTAPSTTSTTAQ